MRTGGVVSDEPALLEEVTDLVEQPAAILGSFEERYLSLPSDVLTTVMKKHQRYFPVVRSVKVSGVEVSSVKAPSAHVTPDTRTRDTLLPYFITIANGTPREPDVVRAGNEGVIRARYADAAFFVEHDRRQPLADVYAEAGYADFSGAARLDVGQGPAAGAARAVGGAAAGAVRSGAGDGGARRVAVQVGPGDVDGGGDDVAAGHHGPRVCAEQRRDAGGGAGDLRALPAALQRRQAAGASLPGLAVGLANRLDSIAGLFAVGLEPSGSADPFGLRRDALGIVQNLAEAELSFSVRDGIAEAARLLPVAASQESQDKAVAFVAGRLENWLRERGYPYDVVQAVLAERGGDPAVARRTVAALAEVVTQPDWPAVLTAYARCKRIVRSLPERYPLAPGRDTEPATQALLAAYEAVGADGAGGQ